MEQFAKTGDFCPNEACPDYGKLQDGQRQPNIIKSGKTKKGVHETPGTLFFRKRTPEHEILETLAFSKEVDAYKAAAAWEDCYYNLIRSHKSLRLEGVEKRKQRAFAGTTALRLARSYPICLRFMEAHGRAPLRYASSPFSASSALARARCRATEVVAPDARHGCQSDRSYLDC